MPSRFFVRVVAVIFGMIATTLTMSVITFMVIRPLSFVRGYKCLLLAAYPSLNKRYLIQKLVRLALL